MYTRHVYVTDCGQTSYWPQISKLFIVTPFKPELTGAVDCSDFAKREP